MEVGNLNPSKEVLSHVPFRPTDLWGQPLVQRVDPLLLAKVMNPNMRHPSLIWK